MDSRVSPFPMIPSTPCSTRHPLPPRRRLDEGWSPSSWRNLALHYEELEGRSLASLEDLQGWLLDWSELESAISGVGSRLHAATACNTEDEEAEKSYLLWQTEVLPEAKKVGDRLDHKFLDCSHRSSLDSSWDVFVRELELQVRLYQEKNVELEARDEELAVEYGRISGGMTVLFRGDTLTLQDLSRFQQETDRDLREETWRLGWDRRLQDTESLQNLFDRMLPLRDAMAINAGFPSYREFKHLEWGRLDYEPEDCLAFHEAVEREVMPAIRKVQERRASLLGLETLRPWDFGVDPCGRPPFSPFQDSAEQVEVCAKIMAAVDFELADELEWMEAQGLLDLETRPGKRPGGFMDTFEDVRWPFIFSNSAPTHDGVETLIHETGHAFHALLAREREPLAYRNAPLEFAEVASMGLEAMASEHYQASYPAAEAQRARLDALEGSLGIFPRAATVDAFQHWLYTHPGHSQEERNQAWLDLSHRFSTGLVDWGGLEEIRANHWQATLHLFEVPFYYIEYAIAQNGALQVWNRYRQDPILALADWRSGLTLGGSRPLPELFSTAGLQFDPRGELLTELVASVMQEWKPLAAGGQA